MVTLIGSGREGGLAERKREKRCGRINGISCDNYMKEVWLNCPKLMLSSRHEAH